jgi:hypothetical protein
LRRLDGMTRIGADYRWAGVESPVRPTVRAIPKQT